MEKKELLTVKTKPLTYLCRFDEKGCRQETYLSVDYTDEKKADMLKNGYVEITQEEWEYYSDNRGKGDNGTGYVRDPETGKPVSAPAHIPTKAEKLAQLDSQYDIDKAEMRKNMTNALLLGDDSLIADLRAEMTAIDTAYEEERQAIIDG